MTGFFALILALLCVWFIAAPYRTGAIAVVAGRSDESSDEADRLRQRIKDLELDFATGKVAHDEYSRMKDSILREAAEIFPKEEGRDE